MEPLVSVVVPIYKAEAFLDRCVESLVGQTYRNLEIILVDDGSPDRCGEMCDAWAQRDSRITVIHKQNAGAGYARNSGLDASTGQYLMFVDADDLIALSTVEKCMELVRQTGADMVMFGRTDLYADGTTVVRPVVTDEVLFTGDRVVDVVLPELYVYKRGIGVSACGRLYARHLLCESGLRFYSEKEFVSEDACFTLDVFAHLSSVAILPENFYFYFKNDMSFSHTFRSGQQQRNNCFLQKCLELCEQYGYPEQVVKAVCARYRMYSIAGMKLLLTSPLSRTERNTEWRAICLDALLHRVVSESQIGIDNLSQRIFWRLFRWRLYGLCRLLLLYKSRK